MNHNVTRQLVNVLAVLATLVVNGLANALPLNGKMTGAISDQFRVFFVPAGYVFAIWGIIYIGLIAFGVYQALPAQRENPRLQRIGYWFALSCAANIAWLFAWHYEVFLLTIFLMVVLLLTLIVIYLRLDRQVSNAEKWSVNIPFSVYLGWISVATIANATDVLDYLKWNSWGLAPELWAVILMVIGVVLAAVMSFKRGDIPYQLVLIWAFAGIAVKQAATPLVTNAAWVLTGLLVVVLIAGLVFRKQNKPLSNSGRSE